MTPSRRRILHGLAAGVGLLAGCTAALDDVPDLVLRNHLQHTATVRVTATSVADGEQLLSRSVDVPTEDDDGSVGSYQVHEFVTGGETARVAVAVQNGPEGTHEFSDEIDTDAKGLWVNLYPDRIGFGTVFA